MMNRASDLVDATSQFWVRLLCLVQANLVVQQRAKSADHTEEVDPYANIFQLVLHETIRGLLCGYRFFA